MNRQHSKRLKYILTAFVGFIIILLCNQCVVVKGRYRDIRLPGEGVNPTSYVFDFPKAAVMKAIDSCFNDHRIQISSWPRKFKHTPRIRKVSLSHYASWMELSITIGGFGDSPKAYVWQRGKNKERPICYPIFQLLVDSLAEKRTKVELKCKSYSIYAGNYLMYNPISQDIGIPRFKEVGSTTIEEYEILKIIGIMLGQKGMPPVNYPSGVTLEDIKEEFTVDGELFLPFTKKDMVFGLPEKADSVKHQKQ